MNRTPSTEQKLAFVSGIVMEVSRLQYPKGFEPRVVSPLGRVIPVRL